MKFSCSQSVLNKALNTVNKAVSVRSTIPILKGILLKVEGGELKLTASNLDMSIETFIDVQSSEDGSLVVSAKLFSEIIRRLPNAIVCVEEDGEGKLNVSCLGSSFNIVALPADEFPSIGEVEESCKTVIRKDTLKNLIDKTSFAASIDEKKGVLVGILLSLKNDKIETVALDGFRMAVANTDELCNVEKSVIVPARILTEVSKILSDLEDDSITLYLDDKKLKIASSDTFIISRLLEGEFIRYEDIIPKTYKTRCIISKIEMLSSIERASLLAKEGKNNLIKMTVSDGEILINSRSEEGNVNEKLSAEIEGEDIVIGFNSKYISDVLKSIEDDEIAFEMTSPVSASLIRPVEGNRYTYLVLPVRISAV